MEKRKNEFIQGDKKVVDELNTFFKKAVWKLKINENPCIINQFSDDILECDSKLYQ